MRKRFAVTRSELVLIFFVVLLFNTAVWKYHGHEKKTAKPQPIILTGARIEGVKKVRYISDATRFPLKTKPTLHYVCKRNS